MSISAARKELDYTRTRIRAEAMTHEERNRELLAEAQRSADAIVARAHRDAAAIIGEAQAEAAKIIANAQAVRRMTRIRGD